MLKDYITSEPNRGSQGCQGGRSKVELFRMRLEGEQKPASIEKDTAANRPKRNMQILSSGVSLKGRAGMKRDGVHDVSQAQDIRAGDTMITDLNFTLREIWPE